MSEQRPITRAELSDFVIGLVGDALRRGLTEEKARLGVAAHCRNPAEIERAMELFRRWRGDEAK